MEFKRAQYNIVVEDYIIDQLDLYKQKGDENESGGILLGFIMENNLIKIKKISVPNEKDISSRCYFERNKEEAQKIIDKCFKANRKMIYLGEWHTHPEKNPTPSCQDKKMIKEQFHNNIIETKFLLLLIQGTEKLYCGLYNGKKIIESDNIDYVNSKSNNFIRKILSKNRK